MRDSEREGVSVAELVAFVRERGLAVVATSGPTGAPEAALVGIAATDRGEIVFDTSARARKLRNIEASPRVALVIGWEDELTAQVEGSAEVLSGDESERCLAAYFEQYPDGRERACDPEIVHVRVAPDWVRISDFRRDSFGVHEGRLGA